MATLVVLVVSKLGMLLGFYQDLSKDRGSTKNSHVGTEPLHVF